MWYYLYSKTLKSQEILINPYDRCIANSTIKDKQCTISWCVDDNKVSHSDEEVNTKVIENIAEHFGNLIVLIGGKHKFLGMYIELLSDGKLSSFMIGYIEVSIDLFGEELSANVLSSAEKGLQNIS